MDAIDTSPRASKARKTDHATSPPSKRKIMRSLIHVDTVMHRVLQFLPLDSLAQFFNACGDSEDLKWTLSDAELWKELLEIHFGGRRCVTEDPEPTTNANDEDDEMDDDHDSDQDNDEDEYEDDEEEDSANDDQQDENEEAAATSTDSTAAPAPSNDDTTDTEATEAAATSPSPAPIDLEQDALPSWFDARNACEEAREFVLSLVEWTQFRDRLSVVRGDIGVIENIGNHTIDAIAFPGNNSMSNAHNGSSGVVFRRAGVQLETHTRSLNAWLRPGQTRVTPGFNAGVRVIIHCHGPYLGFQDPYPVLAQTYRSALTNAMEENVQCLAMASISTGNHALPIEHATRTAVRAIQKFLRLHHGWQGQLGVVCYDGDVLAAFQSERERVLKEFNGAE